MIIHVNYKGLEPSARVDGFFETKARKISRFTRSFQPDAVHLRGTLNRHSRNGTYTASLRLSFPQKVLTAKESGAELMPALHAAVEDLFKQLEKFMSRLNREHLRRRDR
ncbi:MAG: HPF/RaiA family ribosome-associated protein [Deltaproteobacteria bacterium]|nr:HPF/RaiA family ribosome-associated protein [Deltaproteobacteria bacterium]